jgi:hypothetical protein
MNISEVERKTLRETVTRFDVELEALEMALSTIHSREARLPDWYRVVNHRLTTFFESWKAFKAKCDGINLESLSPAQRGGLSTVLSTPPISEVEETPEEETPTLRPAGRMDPRLG